MHRAETWIFRPGETPPGLLVTYSGRGTAPPNQGSPTAFLARSFASALEYPDLPIARARQVHGEHVVTLEEPLGVREDRDAGQCDILATARTGVALAIQTADCVPILLAGEGAIGAVHAGWRGSALGAAAKAVGALEGLGAALQSLRAWMGPSIGSCCYEVGDEVASRFAGNFLSVSSEGKFRLDLAAVNRAQLEAAGVPAANISVHPACTRCGGEKYASYRRDGAASGRMIALVARLS